MILALSLLFKGFLITFSMMLAIGPITLLCISRTLEKGRLIGFAIGLGAATADGIYGSVAAFGLSFISDFLADYDFFIRLIGGLFLLYLGVKTYFEKTDPTRVAKLEDFDFLKSFLATLFLTLTSPMTIILFMTIFAGLGVGSESNSGFLQNSFLVLGVFLGSIVFYIIIISIVSIFGKKMSSKHLAITNKFAGILICSFGGWAIWTII